VVGFIFPRQPVVGCGTKARCNQTNQREPRLQAHTTTAARGGGLAAAVHSMSRAKERADLGITVGVVVTSPRSRRIGGPLASPGQISVSWFPSSGLVSGRTKFLSPPLTTRAPGASPAHANHRHRDSHTPSTRFSHSPGKACMCGPFSALHGSSQDRGGWSADKVGDGCQPWLRAHSACRTEQRKAEACRLSLSTSFFFSIGGGEVRLSTCRPSSPICRLLTTARFPEL